MKYRIWRGNLKHKYIWHLRAELTFIEHEKPPGRDKEIVHFHIGWGISFNWSNFPSFDIEITFFLLKIYFHWQN